MKIIKEYLDSLFLTVPITTETKKAKEDLLAIMEDHYHELIAEGKSEHEAIGAVISEFGSIDEILAELELEQEEEYESYDDVESVSLDEAFDFWAVTRRFAFELSLGILLLALSMASIMFIGFSEIFAFLGLFGFAILVAVGIGFIISGSMKYVREKRKLDDRPLARDVHKEAFFQLENYEKSFRMGLSLGIGLCVLSIPTLFFFASIVYSAALGVSTFFVTGGVGAFLIIYTSIVRNGFKKMTNGQYFVSDEDHPGPRATKHSYGAAAPLMVTMRKFYWPLVFLFYLFWSNLTGWESSWIIFVVAGIFYSLVSETFKRYK